VTAKAGGAQKVCWVLKKDGADTIVAADQFSYTLSAGRVVADTSYVLQFKAVYATEVKTKDIPVTVKETIPEPEFTLKAPSKWNGRDMIEVMPEISNLKAMKAKDAGELHYTWKVSGGAVIKEIMPDKLVLNIPVLSRSRQ
jgi:patatin-like phospholipase/acyl hydrolase